MATPPFDIAHTTPGDSDIISQFPSVERTYRDVVESWLTLLSDPATGLLKPTAFPNPLVITSTDAGAAAGPTLTLYRDSASPAAADIMGALLFNGEDSAGNTTTYSNIYSQIVDPTNGSEDASLILATTVAGVDTTRLSLTAAGVTATGVLDVGAVAAQSTAEITNRGQVNAFEWGHSNPAGYGNVLDYGRSSGLGRIIFHGEHGTNDNSIRTRGNRASVIQADAVGGLNFGNAASANADNQVYNNLMSLANTGNLSVVGQFVAGGTVFAGSAAQVILSMSTISNANGLLYLRPDGWNDDTGELVMSNVGATFRGTLGVAGNLSANVQLITPQVTLTGATGIIIWNDDPDTWIRRIGENEIQYVTGGIELARMTSTSLHVGRTIFDPSITGISLGDDGQVSITHPNETQMIMNRTGSDGVLQTFRRDNIDVGFISVAGVTVTYGAFMGSHWSQLTDNSRPDIPMGTICETIDELCEWTGETNEHLAKFKVSDTFATRRPYGVFASWDNDDKVNNDAYIASLGAFLIRINVGETVYGGDWIMSAGNGCGVVMDPADDPRKHVATVTAAVATKTYPDGSYLVPCTLHCG